MGLFFSSCNKRFTYDLDITKDKLFSTFPVAHCSYINEYYAYAEIINDQALMPLDIIYSYDADWKWTKNIIDKNNVALKIYYYRKKRIVMMKGVVIVKNPYINKYEQFDGIIQFTEYINDEVII